MKFIFESSVPGRLPFYEFERRVEIWKKAKFTHVMIQVDDGRGSSWASQYTTLNPNSYATALQEHVAYLRINNFKVIGVFNLAGIFQPDVPIRPDLLISGVTPPHYYYDIWNPEVVEWRTRLIDECLSVALFDMVGLDFVRTGRPAIDELITESDAVIRLLSSIRTVVPYPILHLSNVGWIGQSPILQGIDARRWYREGLVDYSCLFWYNNTWPKLRWIPQDKTVLLASSYDTTTTVPHSGLTVHRIHQQQYKDYPNLAGYGLYTANMLTYEQADYVSLWKEGPYGI